MSTDGDDGCDAKKMHKKRFFGANGTLQTLLLLFNTALTHNARRPAQTYCNAPIIPSNDYTSGTMNTKNKAFPKQASFPCISPNSNAYTISRGIHSLLKFCWLLGHKLV